MHYYYWTTPLLVLAFLSQDVCNGQPPLTLDNTAILDVTGRTPGTNWYDSYSVGDSCYCQTTFDHDIGDYIVDTPLGPVTIRQVCEILGPGPGSEGRPVYNDIQCGNGPPNSAGDENDCPGRVDHGRDGCGYIGPRWKIPTNATVPILKDTSSANNPNIGLGIMDWLFLLFRMFYL